MDLDRLLKDSLKTVGEAYRPSDLEAARAEFLRRRRRRRIAWAGGGAVALGATAAIAAVIVLGSGPERLERTPVPVAAPPVGFDARVAEVTPGDGPIGVDVADDGDLWVVNSEDRALIRVDPITQRVVAEVSIEGRSDEVSAEGTDVWVSDPPSGTIRRVDVEGGEAGRPLQVTAPDTHIDIEVADDSVWVASKDRPLTRVDADSGEIVERYSEARPTDVASGDDGPSPDGLYVLDTDGGALGVVDLETGVYTRFGRDSYSDSDNGDLAVGFGALWIAEGDSGTILRVDPDDGEVTGRARVIAGYSTIAIGDDAVWVVSADPEAERYELTRLGALTAARTGTLKLTERPTDVAVAGGTVWITNYGEDTITRVDIES